MTTIRTTDGSIIDLAVVRTSAEGPEFEMGTVARGTNGSEFMYVKAASATPRYTLQYLIACGTASMAVAQLTTGVVPGTPVFVTNSSMDSGAFGWVQAAGQCLLIINGTASANGPLFAAASGTYTDATTTADYLVGVRAYATGSGTVNAFIRWPSVGAYGNT